MNEVILLAGKKLVGIFRLADKRGVDVTEEVNHSIRATLQKSDKVVGKIIVVDSEGQELILPDGFNILNTVKIQTKTVSCPERPVAIQGITTGSGYTADDCLGTLTVVKVPKSGVIYSATYWDLDDEGTQVDLLIFKEKIIQIADHDKFSPVDFDMLDFVTELSFDTFDDYDTSQISEITNIGKAYTAPKGRFWIQAVDRSTKNIAAGSEPRFQLQILSDDPD